MKQTLKSSRIGAVAATLGMALALGGASYAVAQTGSDIGSRPARVAATSEPAGISPVIGKSWTRWVHDPINQPDALPATPPVYSQANLLSNPYATGGLIKTAQGDGQMHADATVQLFKDGSDAAKVTCDVRVDGSGGSEWYDTTITDSNTQVTIPLAGSKTNLAAGDHNVGVRCWATGERVYMESVDLHAVIYGAAVR